MKYRITALALTINDHWGYAATDHNYKSAQDVVRTLVNAVSKNGNLLVNVGPNAYGEIPPESANILREVGQWMDRSGPAIYGCRAAEFEKPEWDRFTQRGDTLFACLTEPNMGHISLKGMKGKVEKARLLRDGSQVLLSDFWNDESQ